jgi:hypothetical protein
MEVVIKPFRQVGGARCVSSSGGQVTCWCANENETPGVGSQRERLRDARWERA